MSFKCFKCNENATIKINVLKYCQNCFIQNFETKISKTIPKLSPDSKVAIFLNENVLSSIVHNFMCKFLEKRCVKNVIFYSTNIKSPCYISNYTYIHYPIEEFDISEESTVKFCKMNGVDILMHAEPLETIACKAFEMLCYAKGFEAVSICKDSNHIINLASEIKLKEIFYYAHLKRIPIICSKHKSNKIRSVFYNFLSEITSKNDLALFNIINTFKKL